MSAKTYRVFKLIIVIALAAFIVWSILMEMPVYLPIISIVGALLLIRLCRNFTRGIMVDERIQQINEKAAAISYRIFSIAIVICGICLIIFKQSIPAEFLIVGETLVYSVCVLMLIHLAFYYYYGHKL
jgi:uncharacterized membrane protein